MHIFLTVSFVNACFTQIRCRDRLGQEKDNTVRNRKCWYWFNSHNVQTTHVPLKLNYLNQLVHVVMAFFALHYYQKRAVTSNPESLNSNKKGAKLPLLSAEGCHTQLDGQHCPLITYQSVFLWVEKPSEDINNRLF